MRIITISREFGSGGRELGMRLAKELSIAYYDKEILSKIAERVKLDEHYIENVLNRSYTISYPYTFRRSFSMASANTNQQAVLLAEQTKIIRELAQKEDCVIVGRAADAILREHRPFNIFVYADMDARLERCRQRSGEGEHLSEKEMKKMIKTIDKSRASVYTLISGNTWGERQAYHLCINTAGMDIGRLAGVLADYIEVYFEGN